MMLKDEKFLDFFPSQLAASSIMMSLNLLQAKNVDKSELGFNYVDPKVLIEIMREAIPCDDIFIGLSPQKQTQDFLSYPIPWYSYIEALTGLDRQRDV